MRNGISILFILLCGLSIKSRGQEKNLGYFVVLAKQNSPLLSDYQNQARGLRLDSLKMKATYGPKVVATSNLMYAPTFRHWGYDPTITNGQNISALMTVQKEFITNKQLQTRLTGVNLQAQSVDNQGRFTSRELELNVIQQYITCYSDQQQLNLTDEIFSLLQKEDTALKKMTQAAVFRQTDYLTFKIALQQQLLAKEQIKAQLLGDYGTLNYICGMEDTSLTDISPPDIQIENIADFEQSLYSEKFHQDSLENINEAAIINLDHKPKISVFADGGYQSALPDEAYKNLGISIGLTFSLPLYDGKQKKLALLKNKIKDNSRQRYRDFARQQYNQQISQLLQQIGQYQKLNNAAILQISYARTLIEANKKQLQTADIRMTDYLLSISNYLNLRSSVIQYETMRLSLINQLNHLILK